MGRKHGAQSGHTEEPGEARAASADPLAWELRLLPQLGLIGQAPCPSQGQWHRPSLQYPGHEPG